MRKLFIFISLFVSLAAWSQDTGVTSPYSRYGFGLLNTRQQCVSSAMGGIGIGMRGGHDINNLNPASYSSLDTLSFVFNVGASIQYGIFDTNSARTSNKNATFDYLTIGFRAKRRLGFSIGVVPYSTVGYDVEDENKMAQNKSVTEYAVFTGEGGLHQAYLGAGWQPFPKVGLSIGANVGFLWGDYDHTITKSFSETTYTSSVRSYEASIRTYTLDLGLQYEHKFKKDQSIALGFTYGLGHKINQSADYFNSQIQSSTLLSSDTLTAQNAFELPHTFGLGLSWNKTDKWRVGIDWQMQKWDGVRFPSLSADGKTYAASTNNFQTSHRIAVGAEYMPYKKGMNYRELIRYRLGFAYTSPYQKISNVKGPSSYLVTAGVSLPIVVHGTARCSVNMAAQYERIQPSVSTQLKENYIRLCLGITFYETWFLKWKVQ